MSDQDYERLKRAIPSTVLKDDVFRRALSQKKADMEMDLQNKIEDIEGLGYIVPPSYKKIIQVKTIEEAEALPKGTRFTDPNGVMRIR